MSDQGEITPEMLQHLSDLGKEYQGLASENNAEFNAALTNAGRENGLNVPAFRIAHRIRKAADKDPIKGRTLWDDVMTYGRALGLDDLPEGMFAADEARSGREESRPAA